MADFQNNIVGVKHLLKGLISDGSTSEKPANSVSDCLNIDFHPSYVLKRREPYLTTDTADPTLVSILTANGYAISKFITKNFIDADGTTKNVQVVFATLASNPLKIYIKEWLYCML